MCSSQAHDGLRSDLMTDSLADERNGVRHASERVCCRSGGVPVGSIPPYGYSESINPSALFWPQGQESEV
jgi:hypothetical protein